MRWFSRVSQTPWLTHENVRQAEGTLSYKEMSTLIQKIHEDWIGTDASGIKKRKYDLLRCVWGEMKEGESILAFQVAILKQFPPRSRSLTQIDTLLTSNLASDMRVWRRGVKNFIFKVLPSPICNPIKIFLHILTLYHTNHRKWPILLLWLPWEEERRIWTCSQNSWSSLIFLRG